MTDDSRTSRARVWWIGHATVSIEMDGVRILTDPVLRGRLAHLFRHTPLPVLDPLHPVDAVLISHMHQDHLDIPSLKRVGRDTRILAPRGAGPLLLKNGFQNVTEMAIGESVMVGAVRVIATPANHNGFRPPFGPRGECLGFIVEGSERIYFAGDTDLFSDMADLGPVDLALLPIWGWGPSLGPGHLDPLRAVEALGRIAPVAAVPIHWGTLRPLMLSRAGSAFLSRPPIEFAALAAMRTPEVDVHILRPGDWRPAIGERPAVDNASVDAPDR
jgi:L-ascorbate metabolism protein UlaG (beta-lactamase superfamily)